jgi:hypothetical protein
LALAVAQVPNGLGFREMRAQLGGVAIAHRLGDRRIVGRAGRADGDSTASLAFARTAGDAPRLAWLSTRFIRAALSVIAACYQVAAAS